VSRPATIGKVQECDLHIHKGSDVVFTVDWWGGAVGEDPVDIIAAEMVVRPGEGEDPVLTGEGFFTLEDNRASLHIPAASLAALEPMDGGVWALVVESAELRTMVTKGQCFIREGVAP